MAENTLLFNNHYQVCQIYLNHLFSIIHTSTNAHYIMRDIAQLHTLSKFFSAAATAATPDIRDITQSFNAAENSASKHY